uniref:Secreted protein n=1 Tax=Romanomermis culicivorax TaxID=13658 RepID=A0A915IAI5_ROMCU
MLYASKWIALMMGSLFFFWRLGRNWVPTRAYIPAQLSAPSKEMMMVWSPSTRENSTVQSSGVAVKVSMAYIMPFGNGS